MTSREAPSTPKGRLGTPGRAPPSPKASTPKSRPTTTTTVTTSSTTLAVLSPPKSRPATTMTTSTLTSSSSSSPKTATPHNRPSTTPRRPAVPKVGIADPLPEKATVKKTTTVTSTTVSEEASKASTTPTNYTAKTTTVVAKAKGVGVIKSETETIVRTHEASPEQPFNTTRSEKNVASTRANPNEVVVEKIVKKTASGALREQTYTVTTIGVTTKCAGCGKMLGVSEYINAVDKSWHEECFTCSKCGKRLNTHRFNVLPRTKIQICEPCLKSHNAALAAAKEKKQTK